MFIPTLPQHFCTVTIKCTVTVLRWLLGQIATDVTHPDISDIASGLCSCSPPLLPAYMQAMYSLHPAPMAHTRANAAFSAARNYPRLISVDAPVVSSPPRFDCSAEGPSLICWKTRLFCLGEEGGPPHRTHTGPYMWGLRNSWNA